ncbi:MAG: hypothetical protein HS111_17255 [Kofleriaceae bacterium]|nr:hypothetical protein [Kofleriaceae bacterium]MCL4223082.1 hypothetical protein [Myxococcales bacterium]
MDRALDRWSHARARFDEHFRPLRDAGYDLERLADADSYWRLHEVGLRGDFPPEVFFLLSPLRSAAEREGQARLAASRDDHPLTDFTAVRRDGELVAMFSGEQRSDGVYRMWHTNIRADHRRRGIYGHILRGTIAYTRALGFDTITSEHAPSNNAILIAKLRAGFRVYGFELDPGAGPSLVLRYFHNPEHLAAYELRCGLATLTPRLRAHATGAFAALRDQMMGGPPDRDDGGPGA